MRLCTSVSLCGSQEAARNLFASLRSSCLPICPIDNLKAMADAATYDSLTIPEQFSGATLNFQKMIGSTNKTTHLAHLAPRRSAAKVRAMVWLALVSWLFTFALCTAEMVASGASNAVDSDLESVTPHASSDEHHHPQQPHTDSCCTLRNIPVPTAAFTLPAPLYNQLVAILTLFLILPLILFVPFRTRLHITDPPGQSRHLLFVHSISPNAPPR